MFQKVNISNTKLVNILHGIPFVIPRYMIQKCIYNIIALNF